MKNYRAERYKKIFGHYPSWEVVKEGVSFKLEFKTISTRPAADEIADFKRNYPCRRMEQKEGD